MNPLLQRAKSYGKACMILLVFGLILIYASAVPGGVGAVGELIGSLVFLGGLGLLVFILWSVFAWLGQRILAYVFRERRA